MSRVFSALTDGDQGKNTGQGERERERERGGGETWNGGQEVSLICVLIRACGSDRQH